MSRQSCPLKRNIKVADTTQEVTVYTANKGSAGILRTAIDSVRDIYRHRYLIWVLFFRDFKAQFKQNLLGYLWAVLAR